LLWLRKIVFYIFTLIYLILCPLIIARLLGFVVNPQTHQLVKTGLVYLSTNPPEANVFIDGRLAHQKTPLVIRDLTPGKHFIRIELSDYFDWERTIPIVGNKATVLANILLIPKQWPTKKISSQPYENILFINDDLLLALNPLLKNLDVYHTTQGIAEDFKEDITYNQTSLFSQKSIYADGQLVQLYNEPKSSYILVEATLKDKHKFLWANLNENPPRIEDISDLFTDIPHRIVWSSSNNENIYAFYPSKIYRINIKDKAIYPQDADQLPTEITRNTLPITQEKFLINDKNDLLTREWKWIRIYPKNDFDTPQVYDIAKSKPKTNMYFEERNGELFYLDDDTNYLSVAQILPYHPILNIPIPDALRIKNSDKKINI